MNYAKRLRNLKITKQQSRYAPTLLFQMYKETKNMNDKIKELYVGQEFANYRRLCEFLGEEYKKWSLSMQEAS